MTRWPQQQAASQLHSDHLRMPRGFDAIGIPTQRQSDPHPSRGEDTTVDNDAIAAE